jgi:hypothetical protein
MSVPASTGSAGGDPRPEMMTPERRPPQDREQTTAIREYELREPVRPLAYCDTRACEGVPADVLVAYSR